MLTGDANGWC